MITSKKLRQINYPMFKTTFLEKVLLVLCLLSGHDYLCSKIYHVSFFQGQKETLLKKVSDSLNGYALVTTTLSRNKEFERVGVVFDDWFSDHGLRRKIRTVWIFKLLSYKGD